ncbi:MAG: hypothetical protein LBI82_09760 [Dysgonamonadaceae bacterium]|nr:hypothetical protein [Dysgonamonadaceae bacterium]
METVTEKTKKRKEKQQTTMAKKESKIAKYWRTEYREGVILDMRAVLK